MKKKIILVIMVIVLLICGFVGYLKISKLNHPIGDFPERNIIVAQAEKPKKADNVSITGVKIINTDKNGATSNSPTLKVETTDKSIDLSENSNAK